MVVTSKEMGAPTEWMESFKKRMCDGSRSREGNSGEYHQATRDRVGGPFKKTEVGWERSERRMHRGRVPGAKSKDVLRRKEQSECHVQWSCQAG